MLSYQGQSRCMLEANLQIPLLSTAQPCPCSPARPSWKTTPRLGSELWVSYPTSTRKARREPHSAKGVPQTELSLRLEMKGCWEDLASRGFPLPGLQPQGLLLPQSLPQGKGTTSPRVGSLAGLPSLIRSLDRGARPAPGRWGPQAGDCHTTPHLLSCTGT